MKPHPSRNPSALLCAALLLAAGCASTTRTTQVSSLQRQTEAHRSAENSRHDSLSRQEKRQSLSQDTATQTLLVLSEPLPADRTQVRIPLRNLAALPQGASYSSRSGRAEIKAERQGDTLIITGRSDSTTRRNLLIANSSHRREQRSDSLSANLVAHRTEASAVRDSTTQQENFAATTEKQVSGGLFSRFLPGLLIGALLTLLFCQTDLAQMIRAIFQRIF